MRPAYWQPPVALSETERTIIARMRTQKLFIFLRHHRHELFDDAFQTELAQLYEDKPKGQPPVPPAQLALATILQAYLGLSDDDVIDAVVHDRRWQLVLHCLGTDQAPFSKGTLIGFRTKLLAANLDRRLLERTVELAKARGGFGYKQLRVALDSSPLWGAGRVEDTYNLVGHALAKALGVVAQQQGRELASVAAQANAELVAKSSLKAALDLDWNDPTARQTALGHLLAMFTQVEAFFGHQPTVPQAAEHYLHLAQQVVAQDVEERPDGPAQLKKGVAPERLISVADPQMRHGRKSSSVRFNGYKRHVLLDLDSHLLVAVGLSAANAPEASITTPLSEDLQAQQLSVRELHIDRAYLSSAWVRQRAESLTVVAKTPKQTNRGYYPKTAFTFDWSQGQLVCPQGVRRPLPESGTVHFPAAICQACPQQERCSKSKSGRSVSIHPDERFLAELRQQQQSEPGRARLRQRVKVEHALAHIEQWQGRRARYLGARKNLFDLRRVAVVHNLHVIARMPMPAQHVG